MFWPIALGVVWVMAMVTIAVWLSQYVAEANQRIRRAYDRGLAAQYGDSDGAPEPNESRFNERDDTDSVVEALEQRLRTKDNQLHEQAEQLNLQAEKVKQLMKDLAREQQLTGKLEDDNERLEGELQSLTAVLRQRAIRSELAKIGWLPLHGSSLPADGEPILVGCLDDGGTLRSGDGVWHANFAGINDSYAVLSDGAGGGVGTALDGSAMWIPVHTWRVMVDRDRSIELLKQLDRSVATRLDESESALRKIRRGR